MKSKGDKVNVKTENMKGKIKGLARRICQTVTSKLSEASSSFSSFLTLFLFNQSAEQVAAELEKLGEAMQE